MATNTNWYMKADGIQGDAITQGYEKQVALDAFDQPISAEASAGSAPAQPVFQNAFAHMVGDSAAPLLFKTIVNGQLIPSILVSGLKTIGKGPAPFVQFTYTNAYLTGLSFSMGDQGLNVDSCTFNFQQIGFEYFEEKNGYLSSTGPVHYDLLAQKVS
ncbi:type VI secretion system tube protein Hcp [Granulicella sp. dw_53]|uniref:type VI secretion system tube protein Hcp n=1 Tax=Granulicella sp. dw_53 TaxID=2719792 RepID=UPI001BD5F684|nr:type VI secretion system tube protein Hcp [Granulicella sp. dw_53]